MADFEEQEEREFDLGETEGDNPEAEVEVDIDVEGDEDAEAAEEPEQEPEQAAEPEPEDKPKRRGRLDERLAALARRAAEAEARAADAERRAAENAQRVAANDAVQIGAMEAALKAELSTIERDLIEAKTLGDYAKEVSLSRQLARKESELSAIEAYRASQLKQTEEPAQKPQASKPQYQPETAAWIASNSWYDPESPEYDAEMRVDAEAFATKLNLRYQREGKTNEIGSREYFAAIDEHMAKIYPDVFDEPAPKPKGKMPQMKADKTVAPVARQSAPTQPQAKSSKVRLTAEQRNLAESISPHLPPQQAWAVYARNM